MLECTLILVQSQLTFEATLELKSCYLTLLNSCYILFDYVIALFLKQEYSLYLFSLIISPRQQLLFLNIIKVWNMLFFWWFNFMCVTLARALFMQNILRILNLELQGCWSLRKVIQKTYSYLDSQWQEIFSHNQLRTGLVQVFIKAQSLNLLLHLQK